jgi:hypothetical protein
MTLWQVSRSVSGSTVNYHSTDCFTSSSIIRGLVQPVKQWLTYRLDSAPLQPNKYKRKRHRGELLQLPRHAFARPPCWNRLTRAVIHGNKQTFNGITLTLRRERDSSVSIVTMLHAARSAFSSRQGQEMSLYPQQPDRLWDPLRLTRR